MKQSFYSFGKINLEHGGCQSTLLLVLLVLNFAYERGMRFKRF